MPLACERATLQLGNSKKDIVISAATWLTLLSTTCSTHSGGIRLGERETSCNEARTKYHTSPSPHAKSAIRWASTVRNEEHGQQ